MYTFIQQGCTKLNKSDSKVSIKESPKYKMIKCLNCSLYVCMYVFIYLFHPTNHWSAFTGLSFILESFINVILYIWYYFILVILNF